MSGAKSLTPGAEHQGVGHPATRHMDGASRGPGQYPTSEVSHGAASAGSATRSTTTSGTTAPNEKPIGFAHIAGASAVPTSQPVVGLDPVPTSAARGPHDFSNTATSGAMASDANRTGFGHTAGASAVPASEPVVGVAPSTGTNTATNTATGPHPVNPSTDHHTASADVAHSPARDAARPSTDSHTTHSTAAPVTPKSSTIAEDPSHHRTGSAGSSGKKIGFMHKLKGEMKVFKGKLQNDPSSIELGEKMKHGGGSNHAALSGTLMSRSIVVSLLGRTIRESPQYTYTMQSNVERSVMRGSRASA